jgi:hypothetical protein
MVGFNAGGNGDVRSEVAELFEAIRTGGRCCGWSATQPRSGGGFLRVECELQTLPSAFLLQPGGGLSEVKGFAVRGWQRAV